jgi:hypothetical protein
LYWSGLCASQQISTSPVRQEACRNTRGAGVLACGLRRRLAAGLTLTHRDGARTRRRGRLRHTRDVLKKRDAPERAEFPILPFIIFIFLALSGVISR